MSAESSAGQVRLRPPQNPVEPRARTWWRLQILIAAAVVVIPLAVLGLLIEDARWVFWILAIVAAALGLAALLVLPAWWYKVHRWEVTETAVYTRTGYFWREWRAAPMSRIQTVDVDRGPLEQALKLGTLTVTTASAKGALKIEGLDHEAAAELAEQLTQVAQSVEGGRDVTDTEWQSLDRRAVLHGGLTVAGLVVAAGVPTTFGIAQGAGVLVALAIVVPIGLLVIGVATVLEVIRLRRTRYRILSDTVELRSGVFVRTRRTMQRDRIRVVDVTADPLARVLGLTKVTVGTGEHSSSGSLDLQLVTKETGEQLRAQLLTHAATVREDDSDDNELATYDPRWMKYAPMSFFAPLIGLGAAGGALEVSTWFGLESELIDWVLDWFGDAPLWLSLAILVVLALILGAIASVVFFIEGWTNYRLDREPGGTLRVRRGLLTTRSLSIDEDRLRGVEIVEQLGVRAAGAARVDAVVTGLSGQTDEEKKKQQNTLLPAAPAGLAQGVAARVLREPTLPSDAVTLVPHPLAARGRRVRWALASVGAVVLALAVLGMLTSEVLLHIAWISAIVLVPVAVLWAFDAYRSLGHGLTGDYLITREGSLRRGTVMLQRRGMVGWTARQSIFQQRAGLITLQATTAAGSGGYRIADADESEGLTFAEQAMPQLIGPFLERSGRTTS